MQQEEHKKMTKYEEYELLRQKRDQPMEDEEALMIDSDSD